jgi:hypothetical protein
VSGAPRKTHCKRNHPLAGKNLLVYKRATGHAVRVCRRCKAIRAKWWRERKGRKMARKRLTSPAVAA